MHRSLFYTHALPQLRSFLPITRSRLTLLGHSPTACTSLGRPLHMWTCGSHSRRIPSPRYRHQETIEDSLRRHHGHNSSHSLQVYPSWTFREHLGTQDQKQAQHYQEGVQEEQETSSLMKGEYLRQGVSFPKPTTTRRTPRPPPQARTTYGTPRTQETQSFP